MSEHARPGKTTNHLREIWYTRCPVPTASGIALQNGWLEQAFQAKGIELRSLRASEQRDIRESHFTHTLEHSFRQGGNAPALYARSEGADTVLLGLHWSTQYQGILARPDAGIQQLADLKGKRFALPRRVNDKIDFWRSISLQGYSAVLKLAGLTLEDIELVDIPVERSFVDPLQGQMDAGSWRAAELLRQHLAETRELLRDGVDVLFGHSVWGVALREQFNLQEVTNLANHPDPLVRINNGQPKTLTVSAGLLREHPELVDHYVLQLLRAARWAQDNPSPARRFLAIETGSAEAWLDEGIGAQATENLAISLEPTLVEALDRRKAFLLAHGFIRQDFAVQDWFDAGPLQRATAALAQHARD